MSSYLKDNKNFLLLRKNLPFIIFFYVGRIFLFIFRRRWFVLWIRVELLTMAFIPLIIWPNIRPKISETLTVYFIVQAISSVTLIYGLLSLDFMSLLMFTPPQTLILRALIVKIGAAPLHAWFPAVARNLKKNAFLALLTIQKLIPFLMVFLVRSSFKLLLIFAALRSLVGSFMNIIQNNISLILAYSRISHTSWILVSLCLRLEIWTVYFIVYSITIFLISRSSTIKKSITQTILNNRKKIILWWILILSLAGLPPLVGFFPKAAILSSSINQRFYLLIFILLGSGIVDYFVYLRACYGGFYLKTENLFWWKKPQVKLTSLITTFLMISIVIIIL